MVDFRVTLTAPDGADSVGYVADENGILAAIQDGAYLLSDGLSLVDPLPVFDAGGPSYVTADGRMISSIPLNLSGETTSPINIFAVTNGGVFVTNGGEIVTNGAA